MIQRIFTRIFPWEMADLHKKRIGVGCWMGKWRGLAVEIENSENIYFVLNFINCGKCH